MVNYQNSKIYRLISVSGKQYVGSTTQNLAKRKGGHVAKYKAWLRNNKDMSCFYTSFTLLEEGEVDIVLIEEYQCENKEQLLRRERYWIETIEGGCVNKQIPTRTDKEYWKQYYEENKEQLLEKNKKYREENKEQLLEKQKKYYEQNKDQFKQYREENKEQLLEKQKKYREENKEQLLEKQKKYYERKKDKLTKKTECVCGGCFIYNNRHRHERSMVHQDYLKNIS